MRGWLAILVAIAACKSSHDERPAPGAAAPPAKIAGPAIAPIVTGSVTFFSPKDAPWWGELTFACYAAAMRLQPGNRPAEAFEKISPLVAPALAAGDIDLDRDVAAIGAWGCGDGMCLYTAVALRHPDKLPALLEGFAPGAKAVSVGKDHYTIATDDKRTVHLQAVPIAWPSKLPDDPWARDAAHATHVLFVSGLFPKSAAVDPLALADPQAAAARVRDVEAVVPDTHGMCIRGFVGKRDFQPGFQLERARFAFAAPDGHADALTSLLGSTRTLDVEVELALAPAPTPQVVDRWIAEARASLAEIGAPLRLQFASQGPLVDVMFDMIGLIGNQGFRHDIKGSALQLSWRTDRISKSDLARIETRLEAVLGPGAAR